MSSKYISNRELERFNLFYRPTAPGTAPDFVFLNSLPSLAEIFQNPSVFYTFVFQEHPNKRVGHWCLLIKIDDAHFEWFDCLAQPVPSQLRDRLNEYAEGLGFEIALFSLQEPLMSKTNWICGKWCMFRVMTLPNSPEAFHTKLGRLREVTSLDDLVDFTVNFKI